MSLSHSPARAAKPGLVAYLQLVAMFLLAVIGGALGATTGDSHDIVLGSLPGFLGICGLIWIHRPEPVDPPSKQGSNTIIKR